MLRQNAVAAPAADSAAGATAPATSWVLTLPDCLAACPCTLLQLTQLCIQRPGSSLERVIIDLCAQSLRIAVKVSFVCAVPAVAAAQFPALLQAGLPVLAPLPPPLLVLAMPLLPPLLLIQRRHTIAAAFG